MSSSIVTAFLNDDLEKPEEIKLELLELRRKNKQLEVEKKALFNEYWEIKAGAKFRRNLELTKQLNVAHKMIEQVKLKNQTLLVKLRAEKRARNYFEKLERLDFQALKTVKKENKIWKSRAWATRKRLNKVEEPKSCDLAPSGSTLDYAQPELSDEIVAVNNAPVTIQIPLSEMNEAVHCVCGKLKYKKQNGKKRSQVRKLIDRYEKASALDKMKFCADCYREI